MFEFVHTMTLCESIVARMYMYVLAQVNLTLFWTVTHISMQLLHDYDDGMGHAWENTVHCKTMLLTSIHIGYVSCMPQF